MNVSQTNGDGIGDGEKPSQSQQTNQSNVPDPEKRKLIQKQLKLLLHARECQKRENEAGGVHQCGSPHCKMLKNVLKHIASCSAGKRCTIAHCSSSKQIISHWEHCSRTDCPVCLPSRSIERRHNNSNASMTVAGAGGSNQPPSMPSSSQASNGPDGDEGACDLSGAFDDRNIALTSEELLPDVDPDNEQI